MKIKTKNLWCAIFCYALSVLSSNAVADAELKILASIKPLALMAQAVGGEHINTDILVSGSQDPHSFSLRFSDIRKLNEADLVLWVGPQLERFLVKPLAKMSTLELSQLFNNEEQSTCSIRVNHHCEAMDAHVWLDPNKVHTILQTLANDFSVRAPLHADYFEARRHKVSAQLKQTKHDLIKALKPLTRKKFGSAHDAYGHFTRAFGLTQTVAISALPEQRLSAKRWHEVNQQLKDAQCLLVETGDPRGQQTARQLNLNAVEIDILASSHRIQTIDAFFKQLGLSFMKCLNAES